MTNPLQDLLLPGGLRHSLFPQGSRYRGIDTATMDGPDGEPVVYLLRRFLPSPEDFTVLQEHTVSQGERLDNITARYLSDPEQFLQICDANNIMRPREAEKTGRTLRITLPLGVPAGL